VTFEDLELHRRAVVTALRALERALATLGQAILHDPTLTAVLPPDGPVKTRLVDAYTTIRLDTTESANTSPKLHGVVGASTEVLAAARAVNAAKSALKAAAAPLKQQTVRVPRHGIEGGEPLMAIRYVLRSAQASDVSLLAAYRPIPILPAAPRRVAYTRTRNRSVYVMTHDEVQAELDGLDSPDADADRAKLRRCSPREQFARVKGFRTAVRANVWFARPSATRAPPAQVSSELPLLYRLGKTPEAVEVVWPAAESNPSEARPRTRYLEEEPYLATLPIYRYLTRRAHAPRG
jgi:hypothetical protein